MRSKFPEQAKGIQVGQQCRWIHFLQACDWISDDGTKIGGYRVHYANGKRQEIEIIYGKDVRVWLHHEDRPADADRAVVAWTGTNPAIQTIRGVKSLRLFKSRWENPWPEVEIESIDYFSTMTQSAPFLIAITVEQ